tara:strand:+ start:554 stop:775 length:222 start_codon:yes stop_codon:yes gene_type:complete
MKTLYDKLKPELKQGIENNMEKYKFCCHSLITVLKSKHLYSQLTIEEVRELITWSDYKEELDWKFGEQLFNYI